MSESASSTPSTAQTGTDWTQVAHPLRNPGPLPPGVTEAYAELHEPFEIRTLSGGLLNHSFHLRTHDAEFVLQRVSPVFAPGVQDNIDAVTRHLVARDFPAPLLVRTIHGAHSIDCDELGRWRMMPHLGGVCFESLASTAQARSAGSLIGRFHAALADFDAPLAPMGIPFHDIEHFVSRMDSAFSKHRDHALAPDLEGLRDQLHGFRRDLGAPPAVAQRVIHGDLKLGNLLFDGEFPPERDRARAIIDFDTLMTGTLWMELGDAWRSWCNRDMSLSSDGGASEGAAAANEFDLEIFEASLDGFLDGLGAVLPAAELASLTTAPERLALELCVRFVTDALEETYFDWDASKYATRGEHNRERALRQWRFLRSARDTRAARDALLSRRGIST